jgi:YidC/Oxa1 family membrane protein insertase
VIVPLAVLEPIERPLTSVLEWLHTSVGLSWALAIVVLTVMVRIAIVPLTIKQIRSMQKLQLVAPELKSIQAKYKHDKKRQQEEIMNFYRENKVNPAASCLPILLQIPVFIALFYVLRDFEKEVFPRFPDSDLGFVRIIPSITEHLNTAGPGMHWSSWLLLVLYVASQLTSTLFVATTLDRTQRAIFIALPFVFIFFILNFPVGLMLYWVTTNLWTVGQGIVTRRLMPKPPAAPPRRSSRAQPEAPAETGGDGATPRERPPKAAPTGERRVRRRKKRGPQARR